MSNLNFTPSEVVASSLIPNGVVTAVIVDDCVLQQTKKGDGSFIKLDLVVQHPEYKDYKIFDRVTYENPNKLAVDLGHAKLKAYCEACQIQHLTDTSQFVGKQFMIEVEIIESTSYPDTNGVKEVLAGNPPPPPPSGNLVGKTPPAKESTPTPPAATDGFEDDDLPF